MLPRIFVFFTEQGFFLLRSGSLFEKKNREVWKSGSAPCKCHGLGGWFFPDSPPRLCDQCVRRRKVQRRFCVEEFLCYTVGQVSGVYFYSLFFIFAYNCFHGLQWQFSKLRFVS